MRLQASLRVVFATLFFAFTLTVCAQQSLLDSPIANRPTPSRISQRIDDTRIVRLAGNTHPMARAEFDHGLTASSLPMERIVLVMRRSPEQEQALAAFNARQYDPQSPDFHHWLHAEEFGRLFGPSDADMAAVTGWLESHGFSIYEVSKSRVSLQFSGTAAQVQEAFHVEMHRYVVEGVEHIANDRDPAIPEALLPVVTGIASLHDFRHSHGTQGGDYVKRDLRTGKFTRLDPQPQSAKNPGAPVTKGPTLLKDNTRLIPKTTYVNQFDDSVEDLSPYDYATIYNIMPLWNSGITGTGVKIAIIGVSDVAPTDVALFRSTFGLPAAPLNTIHNGTDPGYDTTNGGQGENTLDVEMAGSSAPGATVELVVSASTATTGGDILSAVYITDNEVAPIMSGSYGECELALGSSQNSLYNQTWQQGATAGISIFESAGDEGSAACNNQNATPPTGDSMGLQVNGIASSPYVTAVGGTDLTWPFTPNVPLSTYWNVDNNSVYGNAKSYMPEMVWNSTCTNPALLNVISANGQPLKSTEELCNDAVNSDSYLVLISAGSGGVSQCTTPTGTTPATCAGGYAKPSWQKGVGVPADGKRDIPDVSTFASYGFKTQHTGIPSSQLLLCMASTSPDNSCTYNNPEYIIFQENGGTSAATPLTAGVMALVIQKTGQTQGLANPIFYQLAATENYANCNSSTVAASNSCIFNDITFGTNSQVCATGGPNCVTATAGDAVGTLAGYAAGTGYDLATGLGSINVTNLVNAWPKTTSGTSSATLTPTSVTFPSTTVGTTSATTEVVTLKNTGTASLTAAGANAITLTGANSTSFAASTTCSFPLAAGASCTITLSFDPTAAGTLTGTLSVVDSAGTQTAAITGTGAASSTTKLTVTPSSLNFPSTAVGSVSATQAITISNTGNTAITLSGVTFSGSGASSFIRLSTTCTNPLAAGASCNSYIEFQPTTAGALSATLSVNSNAPVVSLPVMGTGSAAGPQVTVTPGSLTFASTVVGSVSATQAITIKNTGGSAVTLSGVTFSGAGASSFLRTSTTCSNPLAVGASCNSYVEFHPTTTGTLSATLSVNSNAPVASIPVSGTGAAAGLTLTVTPGSLTFASTVVGTATATQAITIKNTGSSAITLSGVTFSGTGASSFTRTSTTCTNPLAAGASCNSYVQFQPTTTGALSATLSVNSNAPVASIPVSGTGAAAGLTLTVTPGTLTFPSTTVGVASATQAITIKNTGSSAITLSGVTFSGTGASSFIRTSTTCTNPLAAGASCTSYVEFTPTVTGALTATLAVNSNATGSPQTVAVSGTGK
jgi:subtilase family serine protease